MRQYDLKWRKTLLSVKPLRMSFWQRFDWKLYWLIPSGPHETSTLKKTTSTPGSSLSQINAGQRVLATNKTIKLDGDSRK